MKGQSSEEELSSSSGFIEREQASPEPFRDFAKVALEDVAVQKKHRGGVGTHFPTLLHLVLTRAEKDGYSHICGWQHHGRCFTVFNRELFVQEVMPQYFRQSQYASFQRQLNLYGFQRLSQKSLDHGSYYHEMFLRTRADLCQGILRAKEKDLRALKAAREEPDFHKMNPMKPITDADIRATETVLMQQKTGTQEGRATTATVIDESFSLNKPSTDPLVTLFKTIMNGIDTNDCWMEPRPIAPGADVRGLNKNVQQASSHCQPPRQPLLALPKPEPLSLPSFLVMPGPQALPANMTSHPSVQTRPTSAMEYLEEKTFKRKADEISSSEWFLLSESLQEDAEDAAFLEDIDFD